MSSLQPVADIRKDYKMAELTEASVLTDPFQQFDGWWNEALQSQIDEVNAMTLATVTPQGKPDARIVLLKGYDDRGFVFYTNYESRKGQEMAVHPYASLVFFWKELERQVRIDGVIEKVSAEESDEYYHIRPRASQVGAWSSPQSAVIADRAILEDNVRHYQSLYGEEGVIPRPSHWGGYRVKPERVEFWQGRRSRLHDRILFTVQGGGNWKIERLAP